VIFPSILEEKEGQWKRKRSLSDGGVASAAAGEGCEALLSSRMQTGPVKSFGAGTLVMSVGLVHRHKVASEREATRRGNTEGAGRQVAKHSAT